MGGRADLRLVTMVLTRFGCSSNMQTAASCQSVCLKWSVPCGGERQPQGITLISWIECVCNVENRRCMEHSFASRQMDNCGCTQWWTPIRWMNDDAKLVCRRWQSKKRQYVRCIVDG